MNILNNWYLIAFTRNLGEPNEKTYYRLCGLINNAKKIFTVIQAVSNDDDPILTVDDNQKIKLGTVHPKYGKRFVDAKNLFINSLRKKYNVT